MLPKEAAAAKVRFPTGQPPVFEEITSWKAQAITGGGWQVTAVPIPRSVLQRADEIVQ